MRAAHKLRAEHLFLLQWPTPPPPPPRDKTGRAHLLKSLFVLGVTGGQSGRENENRKRNARDLPKCSAKFYYFNPAALFQRGK
jgi:hypothetical protein